MINYPINRISYRMYHQNTGGMVAGNDPLYIYVDIPIKNSAAIIVIYPISNVESIHVYIFLIDLNLSSLEKICAFL